MITSHWLPQAIYIAFTAFGAGAVARDHGKPRTGVYNIWRSLAITVLVMADLYWGGFFG